MTVQPDRRLRLGAVSYLNTKPLIHGLQEAAPQADLILDLPSRLADNLARGRLDVALIPAVEYFQHADYREVSDACIACRGPVLSVKLFSRTPLDQIRTLALDEGSRTSAALVQILLYQRFGLRPETSVLPIGESCRDTRADGILLIGDRAIHPPPEPFVASWDLGAEWCRWSGLPFVFALWVARAGLKQTTDIAAALEQARDAGVQQLEPIARHEGPLVGLSARDALTYLRDNLHFTLGAEERRGLSLFRQCAEELGFAPRSHSAPAFS